MSAEPQYISAWAAVGALIVSMVVGTVSLWVQRRMSEKSLAQQRSLTDASFEEQRRISKDDHAQQQRLTEKSLVEQRIMSEQGLAQQRAMSEQSLTEQRKMAGEERVWSTRSDLYVDLLVWLDSRVDGLEKLLSGIEKLHHEAESQEIDDLFANLSALVSGQDEPNQRGDATHARSADLDLAGVAALWRFLDPPVELRERLLLFASEEIRSAFEQYKAVHAQRIVAVGDIGSWVTAIEDSQEAYVNLRAAIIGEVHGLTSGERTRPNRKQATNPSND